jgi:L-histidine Nalpha-methyltransferase
MEVTLVKKDEQFAKDVLEGLSSFPKHLSSKYFYDEKGDKLFQEIMRMPEYYLTDSEYEIIANHKEELLKVFTEKPGHFNIIELGAGDAVKTKVLLNYLVEEHVEFTYVPVDISEHAIESLRQDLAEHMPALKFRGIVGDYFEALNSLKGGSRNIVLFLGSSIGNFEFSEAVEFLSELRKKLSEDDALLIGFDLIKDPEVIYNAYADPHGITAAFNTNLLDRINKELGADFDVSKFKHYPIYDPVAGEARSYLVSCLPQEVHIESLNETIFFSQWELIHVEISKKYDIKLIERLAEEAGFHIKYNFLDSRAYFIASIWCNSTC